MIGSKIRLLNIYYICQTRKRKMGRRRTTPTTPTKNRGDEDEREGDERMTEK